MPRRLDIVRFRVGEYELEVGFTVALEPAERAAQTPDEDALTVAARTRGAGASRPVRLSPEEMAALALVIDEWEVDVETVHRLRTHLPRTHSSASSPRFMMLRSGAGPRERR
jgi:hypothetical protein